MLSTKMEVVNKMRWGLGAVALACGCLGSGENPVESGTSSTGTESGSSQGATGQPTTSTTETGTGTGTGVTSGGSVSTGSTGGVSEECSLLGGATTELDASCDDGTVDPGELCFSEKMVDVSVIEAWITLADLDANGSLEAVLTDRWRGGLVVLSSGTGDLIETDFLPVEKPGPVAAADFNGDSRLDLAVVVYEGDPRVFVFEGKPDGFVAPSSVSVIDRPLAMTAANIDQDATADLVLGIEDQILVRPGAGDGTFGDAIMSQAALCFVTDLSTRDLDGDLDLDIIAASSCGDPPSARFVFVGYGDGFGAFPGIVLETGGDTWGAVEADIDADSAFDVVATARTDEQVSVVRALGDGSFEPQVARYDAVKDPVAVASGDFNSDGYTDVVATGYLTGISILVNDTRGGLEGRGCWEGPAGQVVVGDLNHDSVPDIVTSRGTYLLSRP